MAANAKARATRRVKCHTCGQVKALNGRKYCSELCKKTKPKKDKVRKGYVSVYRPQHPRATTTGYVLEHVLVAETTLGRHLEPGEVVHHVNEVKSDNRAENLIVFPDQSSHSKYHAALVKGILAQHALEIDYDVVSLAV